MLNLIIGAWWRFLMCFMAFSCIVYIILFSCQPASYSNIFGWLGIWHTILPSYFDRLLVVLFSLWQKRNRRSINLAWRSWRLFIRLWLPGRAWLAWGLRHWFLLTFALLRWLGLWILLHTHFSLRLLQYLLWILWIKWGGWLTCFFFSWRGKRRLLQRLHPV